MSNTGRKIYRFLKQIDTTTGLPTGLRKPNEVSDPDYVPPTVDYISCPLTTWSATDPYCVMELGVYTGMLAHSNRIRLINGVADGYSEPNLDGIGIGPYFPPYENLIACPI